MTVRTRKLIGAVLLLLLVTVWALLAMAFAQFAFSSPNAIAAWIFYVVAGMGWIFPAMPLIRWMEGARKADAPPSARPRESGDPESKAGFPLSRE